MKKIQFSHIYSQYDPLSAINRRGWRKAELVPKAIDDMFVYNAETSGEFKNRIQMSIANERLYKDMPDLYNFWNNCVWVDIDYKDVPNATKKSWEDIIFFVLDNIKNNYEDNLYYYETSRSGKGGHFIFYYDVEKTEENFKKYSKISRQIVYNAFVNEGFKDVIDYPGVYDTCSCSICQCVYITKLDMLFNDKCTGETKGIYPKVIEKEKKFYDLENKKNLKFKVLKWTQPQTFPYIEHTSRWRLFNSLSRCFNGEELKNEWRRIAQYIPETNGHTSRYYAEVPYILDWNEKLTGEEYCDIDLMKKFGYEVQIIEYHKNSYLNDQDFLFLINNINEIINK